MTDFHASWTLSRGRLVELVSALNDEQLNWRLHPGSLTIGEAALHVAGVEAWFFHQLTGTDAPVADAVVRSATAGVVNDDAFPLDASEITSEYVQEVFRATEAYVRPHMEAPTEEFLRKEIKSALGPIITGHGALARLAFHPGYHHGQAYLMYTAPDFPR